MSRRTIYTGIRKLEAMGNDDHHPPQRPSGGAKRIRRSGGGRRQVTQRQPGLEEVVDEVLEAHSAGSPTDEAVRWTDLKPVQLAQQVLARAGTGGVDPHERDQQFWLIATLHRQARARGVPVLCVDTKKKERLSHLHRRRSCYSTDVQFVYDHDYRHLATGVLVPHGVYDYHTDNASFITLGTSRKTSAFVCDTIALAWQEDRAEHYPHVQEVLLTFDAGGANAARSLRFKGDLVALSRRLGLRLRVAHYPPYTSKWHPIKHRLF